MPRKSHRCESGHKFFQSEAENHANQCPLDGTQITIDPIYRPPTPPPPKSGRNPAGPGSKKKPA